MYLSKNNLLAVQVAKADADIPQLDNVHVMKDGTTVGSNGRGCIIVSPVQKKVKEYLSPILKEHKGESTTITSETVKSVMKDMPPDKKFHGLLEHCDLKVEDDGEIIISLTDGKRERSIRGKAYRRKYIDFSHFTSALTRRSGQKVVVNLTRFILLLQTIDKIVKTGDEENPVFIEFTDQNEIIIRGVDRNSGQRVIGIMSQYIKEEQKWLKENEWEMSLSVRKKKMRSKKKEKE